MEEIVGFDDKWKSCTDCEVIIIVRSGELQIPDLLRITSLLAETTDKLGLTVTEKKLESNSTNRKVLSQVKITFKI